jgi:hypothetical protein
MIPFYVTLVSVIEPSVPDSHRIQQLDAKIIVQQAYSSIGKGKVV